MKYNLIAKNIVSYNKRWKWASCSRGGFKCWTVPNTSFNGHL